MYRLLGMLMSALTAVNAEGATSATALVSFSIHSINVISITPSDVSMTLHPPKAGRQPSSCMNYTTCFNITTNGTSQKISGSLDAEFPKGLWLNVELDAPSGATSCGVVTLSTIPKELVTGIEKTCERNIGIGYCLHASVQAGQQGNSTRIITYTIHP